MFYSVRYETSVKIGHADKTRNIFDGSWTFVGSNCHNPVEKKARAMLGDLISQKGDDTGAKGALLCVDQESVYHLTV